MNALMTRRLVGILTVSLSTALSAQPTQPDVSLDRVQLAVVLSPRTADAMGTEAVSLKRALESALSSKGMGTALPDMGSRFVAYVDLVPIEEEMAPGGMVAVKEQLTVTFGDAKEGRSIGMFQTEKTAVGKNKEGALRNFSTSLRLAQDRKFAASLDEANAGIISFFERQCPAMIAEATSKAKQLQFEEAIFMTTSVPREAVKCHQTAMNFAAKTYTDMLRHQCAAPFAQARAKWATSKSRQNAAEVAEIIGAIPADSPCYADASLLVNQVAQVIAQHDAAAAQAARDREAWKRKVYQDRLAMQREETAAQREQMRGELKLASQGIEAARQVGIEYARAEAKKKPADIRQTIVFR